MRTSCRMTARAYGTDAADAYAAFAAAAQQAGDGVHDSWHTTGGRVLRLRIAGDELGRALSRAFLPAAPRAEADLTVDLWDESDTGAGRPAAPLEHVWPHITGAPDRLDLVGDGRYARCGGIAFSIWLDRA